MQSLRDFILIWLGGEWEDFTRHVFLPDSLTDLQQVYPKLRNSEIHADQYSHWNVNDN